jgi:hypothetical protein
MTTSVEISDRTPEMKNFNDALRRIMRVSKSDLSKILAKEKAANADKPKRGPKAKSTDDTH